MSEKAKPAGGDGGHRAFLVSDWKAYEKGTLRGFLSLTLPSGLVIHNCTLHHKGDSRWIGLPARQFTKDDGTKSFSPIIEFVSNEARNRFRDAAVEAVERHLEGVR
jgi:DNA-binding cell septation regulator SpoVG